jgi:hypothetical protein
MAGDQEGGWHFYGHCHGEMPNYYRSRDVGVDCPDTGYLRSESLRLSESRAFLVAAASPAGSAPANKRLAP